MFPGLIICSLPRGFHFLYCFITMTCLVHDSVIDVLQNPALSQLCIFNVGRLGKFIFPLD